LGSLKGSTLRILASGLVGLALVVGAATGILAQHSSSSASAGKGVQTPHGAALKGSFRSGVVNLASLPPAKAAGVPTPKTSNTNRPRQTAAQLAAYRQWVTTHTSLLPKATGAPAPKAGANTYGNGLKGVLVNKGVGMNSANVMAAHGGAYWSPPDQALAVAPGYVVEGVNGLMAVYNWSYTVKYGPWTPDQLFSPVIHASATFSDPQITYDAERNRYLIAWLELTPDGNDYIDIAVSKTSTPAPTNFRVYQVPATTFGSGIFCDYPTLGYDYWGMYLTCVTFAVSDGHWIGNNTLALSINKLIDGTGPVGATFTTVYTAVSCGSGCYQPAYRLSPTIEDGVPQAEWLTAIDVTYSVISQNQTVCAITNTVALNSGAVPTYTCVYTTLPLPYDDPVAADQPGAPGSIDPGAGYKQVAYRNGQLYVAFPIEMNCSGNTHDGVYWAAITPQLTTKAAFNPQQSNGVYANYTQAGYFCYTDSNVYMPTLIADTEGDMTLVFNVSNATSIYPSIYYTGRTAADAPGTMEQQSANGTTSAGSVVVAGTHANGSGRWGDYSACALSTNMVTRGVVFCAGEFGGPNADPSGFGWDTELYQIRMQ
jgi:hypothetical protein